MKTTVDGTGIRHILLMVEGTGDLRRTVETIEHLGSEVIPRPASGAPQ